MEKYSYEKTKRMDGLYNATRVTAAIRLIVEGSVDGKNNHRGRPRLECIRQINNKRPRMQLIRRNEKENGR